MVHDLCVRDKQITGLAAPCLKVDLAAGYAVVPDPSRQTQLLVTPTRHILGIESEELLKPESPNYWVFAWAARSAFAKRAAITVPPEDLAMAVNSQPARTQDHLHIHLDCIRPSVRTALDLEIDSITQEWAVLPTKLRGHSYSVMWSETLERDPFKLLAGKSVSARAEMALQTLVVAPTRRNGILGFVLLSRRAHPESGDLGAGEELLDHRCQILSGINR